MSFLKKLAIIFFDIIDEFIHQKNNQLFEKNLNEINVFVDIGSHKGTYTDLILNNISVTEKLILIEPQKHIFKFIQNKYKNNDNIVIYNNVISDKEKIVKLFINKHDLTSSLTTINQKNKYLNLKAKLFGGSINQMIINKYNVKSISLKKLVKKEKLNFIDLIKIDTEGHELKVLEGAGDFLKRCVKYIIIEFHNSNIFINYDPLKIEKFLKKQFYT